MLNLKRNLAFLALCLWASSTFGAVIVFNGELTAADPTYNRPSSTTSLSGVGTAVAYDTYSFVASAGPYSVDGNYGAGILDGYLFLYNPSFAPGSALTNLIAADDDNDPDGAGPLGSLNGSLIPSSG